MGFRKLGMALLLSSVVACGELAGTDNSRQQVGPVGGSGNAPATTGGSSGRLPLQGEYWIRADQLSQPIHVRVLSETAATVEGLGIFPKTLSIETSSLPLAVAPPSSSEATPVVQGAYILRLQDPLGETETGVSAIALSAGDAHDAGDRALIVYAADGPGRACMVTPVHVWQTFEGSVTADHDPTEVTVVAPTVPLGLVPWESIGLRASKSAGNRLVEGVSFQSPGVGAVDIRPGDNNFPMLSAQADLVDWPSLVGHTVQIAGHVVNTNGVGTDPPGSSAWSGSIQVLDFGPSRTGVLDFANGAPGDLVAWGGETLKGDPGCVPPQDPPTAAVATCLRIRSGQGLAVRFQGPLSGVRVHGHADFIPAVELRMASRSGVVEETTVGSDFIQAVVGNGTADELYALVSIPTTVERQIDPGCAEPKNLTAYIESIEPLGP